MQQTYEKLGAFYLGKTFDMERGKPTDELLLYDAKDLTTHAVCVGMTGSGKTGLCLSLLEEAALDGIPTLAIDPKGDLGNLMLTFPALQPTDFAPWIDPADMSPRITSSLSSGTGSSRRIGARVQDRVACPSYSSKRRASRRPTRCRGLRPSVGTYAGYGSYEGA